ncbi:MAG: hypothetical protein JW730_06415 [Anaerolineales bacterium]|nr:hypothetical protein [Anaerolineales bacterium]
MKQRHILIAVLLISIFILPVTTAHAQTDLPVVRAVLFYSTTCGHCEYVINGTLVPLIDKYGEQLQIIAVDVSQPGSQELFWAAAQMFGLEQVGVPFLVFDNTYLIGSGDIPEKFPGLVEAYLAQGGLDWPEIPGLREAMGTPAAGEPASTQSAAVQTAPVPATVAPTSASPIATPGLIPPDAHNISWTDNFARDLNGNILALIVLAGMLVSVAWAVFLFQRTNDVSLKENWAWIIPVLCIVGFGVAGYLAYVETTQTTAVCGPVGDCNTVQQSEYARLFGILPIGVLGLFGYVAIVIAWLLARYATERLAALAALALIAMAAFGTLFSIYLTFLEPFVIGATCAWCLTSSVLMTALMLLSVRPAKLAFSKCKHYDVVSHRKHTRIGVPDD